MKMIISMNTDTWWKMTTTYLYVKQAYGIIPK